MNEGTATNTTMNSVFSLVVIFAIPYIYNGVAAALNAFTGWAEVGGTALIIRGGYEVDTLINAMGGGVRPAGTLPPGSSARQNGRCIFASRSIGASGNHSFGCLFCGRRI